MYSLVVSIDGEICASALKSTLQFAVLLLLYKAFHVLRLQLIEMLLTQSAYSYFRNLLTAIKIEIEMV